MLKHLVNGAARYLLPLALALLGGAFSLQIPGAAQADPPVKLSVSAGLDGYCKDKAWFPVRITLENLGPGIEGQVSVSIPGVFTGGEIDYAQRIILPSQSRKEIALTLLPQGFTRELEVVLQSANQVIAQAPFRVTCIGAEDSLYGVTSDQPSTFNRLLDADPSAGAAFIAQIQPSNLPAHFLALQPLSMLVISNADTAALSESQRRALTGWITMGGHLLVAGGPEWQKTSAGLEDLLPLAPINNQTISELADLNRLIGEDSPLDGETIITIGNPTPDSEVLASVGGIPLLLQRRLGAGAVTFLAANPSLYPLDDWAGFPELAQYLLNHHGTSPPAAWQNGFQSWSDAQQAVSTIPGLKFPSVLLICGFLVLYILAIGPANYLLLRRWGKRELAWFSIPGLVVLFSGVAFLVGGQARGREAILNRINIIQSWPGASFSRYDALIGLFSPARGTFDLDLQGDYLAQPIPEYGGLNGAWTFIQEPGRHIVEDIHVEVGGIQAFAVTGAITAPRLAHSLKYFLEPASPRLSGELILESDPGLEEAVLLSNGRVYPLGDIPPRDSFPISVNLPATSATAGGTQAGYGSSANFTLLEEILGMPYYTGLDDPIFQRRAAVLTALLDPYGPGETPASGTFLLGWSEAQVPLEVKASGRQLRTNDLSFYIIALDVPLEIEGGPIITIPPGFFTWNLLSASSGFPNSPATGPYDSFLQPGSVLDMQYMLSGRVPYQEITNLTLRLEADTGQGQEAPLQISLWNFNTHSWVIQPAPIQGTLSIEGPQDLVGPGGEIRARVELQRDSPGIFLRSLDFTMDVVVGDP